ncbi:conserved hypothetical protein [Ricinus communis]|uniref:Uncharacterized protein n=1 Tax=Ricinus communis TaxID=3988 RepID=B9T3C9_RICCO|nr:conserved hypothetical protein [Ricinus communis]
MESIIKCSTYRSINEPKSRCGWGMSISQHIWRRSPLGIIASTFHMDTVSLAWDKLSQIIQKESNEDSTINVMVCTLWNTWKARNMRLFQNKWLSEEEIIVATEKRKYSISNKQQEKKD